MHARGTPHCFTLFCALREYLAEPVHGFTSPMYLFAIVGHGPLQSYYGFLLRVMMVLG